MFQPFLFVVCAFVILRNEVRNLYLCYMFKDKKLRNTFWIVVSTAFIVFCLWTTTILLFHIPGELIFVDTLVSIVFFFVSISALIKFIRNWKLWSPKYIKIIGVACALFGIIAGGFVIFLICDIIINPNYLIGL